MRENLFIRAFQEHSRTVSHVLPMTAILQQSRDVTRVSQTHHLSSFTVNTAPKGVFEVSVARGRDYT